MQKAIQTILQARIDLDEPDASRDYSVFFGN